MAPETPGNLVVLELRYRRRSIAGVVERVETGGVDFLRVSWNSDRQPPGYFSVGSGAAFVAESDGIRRTPPISAIPDKLGGSQFAWRDVAQGDGLMFVLILPKGYRIVEPDPTPVSVKKFKHRMALYWFSPERFGERTRVSWKLEPLYESLDSEIERLNRDIAKHINDHAFPGVIVEDSGRANSVAAPDSFPHALLSMISSLPKNWKVAVIVFGSLVLASFAVWSSLPDSIKSKFIEWLIS